MPIEPTQSFAAAFQGGVYDGTRGVIDWGLTTTPQLAGIPSGGTVTLTFTTAVAAVAVPLLYCAQASVQGGGGATPCDFQTMMCFSDDPATRPADDPTCLPSASLSPCQGIVAGGTPFVLTGGGYQPGVQVRIGGVAATVASVAPDAIVATSAAAPAPGLATVTVQNPGEPARTLIDAWVATSDPEPGTLYVTKGTGWSVILAWTGPGPAVVEAASDPRAWCATSDVTAASSPLVRASRDGGFFRVE